MTEIKNLTSRINTLILKKDQTADAVQQRKTMLDMSQNGSDDAPGLKGLENLRSEKEVSKQEIEKKIATLNEQAELAKKDAENIQSLANESFEKARMTTEPTQQAALEQKANEILAGNASSPGKSHYMSQYQTALDQIAALNSSLEIINLELENTSLEIAKTTKKIQDYKAADAQMDLQQSIVSMTSQIAQLSGAMSSNLAGIEETIAEYKKISEEAVKSIDTAINTFKKIPRDNADIQQMAKMLQAGALSTRAALLAGNAVFYATLSGNLSSIALPADKSISSPLLTSSDDYKATAVKSSQDAFDGFDLADKEYEGLRFNPNCPIIKSRVLNLFGKAKLAVVFDKTDIYASAVESAKTIVGDATDCTEEFKDSYITKTLDSMKK